MSMRYKNNGDGTFSVQAWEFTSPSGFNGYLYSHGAVIDKMAVHDEYTVNMVWLVRNHRPATGEEI